MEIDARPAIVFKQIYDGEQSYSSMPNVQMPPLTKFGFGALARFDQSGNKIEAIPDKIKQRGFRLVDPEGYTTDMIYRIQSCQSCTSCNPVNSHPEITTHS
jgi:hypothetical protein